MIFILELNHNKSLQVHMCGISAIFKYTAITTSDIDKLNAMNDEMHYRGPDDRGVWHDDTCGMAQVRLSIIGLEKGKQPLFNEDKSLVLICNGEIYNYIELKDSLQKKGHQFNSDSDSETILHLYEEYGEKCLEHLRGMFAFCLWDVKKKQLFAARDRVGEKTLYYAELPSGIVFSSELKAILRYYIEKPEINFECFAEPIRYMSPINKSQTYVEQIKRIESGQSLVINQHGISKKIYWKRLFQENGNISFEQAKTDTLNLLRDSIDISLRSDVPVAVMLSGGVDSSVIAALAKETGREVHTITAGYAGQHDCDERVTARRFANEKGLFYHEIELDEHDFKNCFDEFTQYLDEPITDYAAFSQWAIYKKVKTMGFKVLLSGNGGDEIFYGYDYWNHYTESLTVQRKHQSFFPWKGYNRKKEFLFFVLNHWKQILYAGYPVKINDSSIINWMYEDYTKFKHDATFSLHNNTYVFNTIDFKFSLGDPELGKELDCVYTFLLENTMTMAYLYLSDRLGMGNSIEVRSPFLDYKLIDYVATLPINYKYKKNYPKYFLKETVKGIIPDYILNSPKKGFIPPLTFVNEVVDKYNYNFFESNYKFYNTVLADRILSLNFTK